MQTSRAMSKTRISISILLCGILVFWSSQVSGQEWTDEQKQVWKIVESFWEYSKQGDVEALLANYYVMNSYEWWSSEAIPVDKNHYNSMKLFHLDYMELLHSHLEYKRDLK